MIQIIMSHSALLTFLRYRSPQSEDADCRLVPSAEITPLHTAGCSQRRQDNSLLVFYLAHDLEDPAIRRRVKQLERGGASVTLAGFRRRSSGDRGHPRTIELGLTADGRLGRRARAIAHTALLVPTWGRTATGCEVLIARGLEMLILAALVQKTYCREAILIYECLDIHRLMVSKSILGRLLRFLESRLLRCCALLITSSPAFVQQYFVPTYGRLPPVLLWENRLIADELPARPIPRLAAGAPWRIGWFGVIRCERSLHLLRALCSALPGRIQVDIRGRPTRDMMPQLSAAVASTDGLTFGGAYDRSKDLARIYGQIHFTWAIDFFESGANSMWLLPNRLYEGGAHGAVPIALSSVETGRWLSRHNCGVQLGDEVEASLLDFFRSLDPDTYRALAENLAAVNAGAFIQAEDELNAVVGKIRDLSTRTTSASKGSPS